MLSGDNYRESAEYVRMRLAGFSSVLTDAPEALLVLGSGLGFVADELENGISIWYDEIPHFKRSTAPGHEGRFVFGRLSGRSVLAMQGRLHVYEGYSPEEVAYPIRVANMLGVNKLILTCACGGINLDYSVGDLVLLTDYINFSHVSPLVGFDISGFDARFVDMSYTFDRDYRGLVKNLAARQGIILKEGVYFYMVGPQFETPAEIRAIRTLGGDMVGMSVVHEAVMAQRLGMRTLGIGLVTNMAAGILDAPLTEEEVLVEGAKASKVFSQIVKGFVGALGAESPGS